MKDNAGLALKEPTSKISKLIGDQVEARNDLGPALHEISPPHSRPGSSHYQRHRARSGYHQMSEIEQVSETDKQIPNGTSDIDSVQTPQQPQEHLLVSDDTQPLVNGTVASVQSAQSTTAAIPPQIKRFSSTNISKKFLQKTALALNSSNSSSTVNSSSSSPAPSKAATTTGSATSKPGSSISTSRLVTTKLTQTPSSSTTKWSKDTSIRPSKPSTPGSDGPIVKPGQLSSKVAPSKERTVDSSGKVVWGSVVTSAKANARVQNDFPTAAELKDRADQAAAASAAQRRALDAFRGIHLDPKAQHWDEMTEEDGDFLSGVIEFGDGKQYNVAPTPESEALNDENPSEDRLGNDFDRSWPASRENGMQPQQSVSSPSVSPLTATNPHGERVLFNDRHNRMETMAPPRQAPTTPTLLHAHPSPQTLRPGNMRRESDGRGFREPSAWNGPSQRSTYATSESSDKQGDTRLRHPSATERDKSTAYASGGLGPHLRDRSPDGSGRFPGRNIQRMTRRDSQASSGIVPARSTRALSRESSDRGSAVRQLPPHLGGSMAQVGAAHAPPLLATSPSSIPSRASWRGSPTDTRSPTQVPQTPSVIHSEKMQPSASSDNASNNAVSLASPQVSEREVAVALMEDEATLKQAMAVAAERARKRRLEEEEKRKIEIERAKKKKLADLEAKMQAEKEAKEAKETALKKAEDQARQEKEEAERLARHEAENRAKDKERTLQSATMPPPPSRPPMPSDTVDSWRGSAPARPSITTQVQPSGRRLTNGSSDSRRSPTAILKQKHFDHPQPSPAPKLGPVDLSGKPANSAIIAEVAALQSKTADDSVQVLHFSDLRQLAEGYGQTQSVSNVAVNGSDPFASTEPVVNPRSPTEARPTHPHESSSNLAPVGGGFDDSRGFKPPRPTKSQPPAALNFVPRGSQDHGQPGAPVSAGLSPSWSPRVQDPSQPGYRQAPISVLDDTLSRFKKAIMHSNPVHAGMSSDDIMQGLGRGGLDTDRGTHNSIGSIMTGSSHPLPHYLGKLTGEPTWAQTQSMEPVEEDDFPSVLIPTLSLKRDPVAPKKVQGMKSPQPWRWDHLTFDPPVPTMNRRTLSVMDALAQGPTGGTVHLRIKVPGAPVRNVPYSDSFSQGPKVPLRPRREDLRVNSSSYPSPPSGGLASAPKTAPSIGQWPSKTRGSEEAVWRRAVPVTASLDQPAVPAMPEGSPGIKSAASTKHNRTFSNSISPIGTPPQTMGTWGRSPLSLTVTEDLPDDPSLKAAWNKGSSGTEVQITKNSLRDIADDPPPQIPSSINDLRSEDGDATKSNEKAPTPPTTRLKYDPHRAFQQVSSQPAASQTPLESSPVSNPPSLSSSMYPTPRSNALALSTNRTPRQTPPSSLPPVAPMNPSHLGYSVPYPPPMHPIGSPYTQPMMIPQYQQASTPVMAPPTPGMVHRNAQGMPMQQPPSNQPMWGQQSPAAASPPVQLGFVRQMHHGPLPPAGAYPAAMVQQAPQSLQLYPHPPPGMMHHPPSPAMSPMMAPGMNKPFSTPSRTNSLPPGGVPPPPPMASPALPVSVPVTFQMPPSAPSHGQIPYMMHGHMHPPPTQSPQGMPPHARPPPQGRGVPMHPTQYPPAPNNFPRQW